MEEEHIDILILTQRVEVSRSKLPVVRQAAEQLVQVRTGAEREQRWRQRLVVH